MTDPNDMSVARRFVRDARGSIAIISAAFLLVAVAATAFAVDVGALYLERRTLQGVADLAAMAGASDIDNAERAVAATIKANGVTATVTVERGQYVPEPSVHHTQRFAAGREPYNAIRVNLEKPGQLYFAKAITQDDIGIGVTATAANDALATFSVGSRLLAVRDGIVNDVLGGLLGANISLSAMDYEALIQAEIQLNPFLDALASQLDVTGGTYNDVLQASATVGDVIAAAARVADQSGNAVASAAFYRLLSQVGGQSVDVPLTSLIDLGPLGTVNLGDPAPGLDANFTAMELLSAAVVLANGERQMEIDLGTNIPGLLSLKLWIAIGEPPQQASWSAVGQADSSVRTAQTRLKLIAEVSGIGALQGVRVRLPLILALASAKGRLDSVACIAGGAPSATVAARPGVAEAWIGEADTASFGDFYYDAKVGKAKIVDTSLIKVWGWAHIHAGNTSETMLTFDQEDVDNGTVKRTDTRNIAASLVSTLLKDLKLDVQLLGAVLALPGTISAAVADTLGSVAEPLDAVAHTLLTTLGVHVGEADIRVHGMHCGNGVLAG